MQELFPLSGGEILSGVTDRLSLKPEWQLNNKNEGSCTDTF